MATQETILDLLKTGHQYASAAEEISDVRAGLPAPAPRRLEGAVVNIHTDYWPKPIPTTAYDWQAWDADTYDGAPDSSNRSQIGHGPTEEAAIADLMSILEDDR